MNNKSCLILLILGIMTYTAVFTTLCSLRYQAFFSYEWEDEAAENQMLWNTAHGDLFQQTIFDRKFLIDHFSPIYIFIAPFYRLFPKIYTFYFILSIGLGLGALPIYFLSKNLLNSSFKAMSISYIYLFYPPLHWMNFSAPLEPVLFSVPLLLSAFYFFIKNKLKTSMVFILLSLMCKENIALVVIFMGCLFTLKQINLKYSLTLIFTGAVVFIAAFYWILPDIGINQNFYDFHLGGWPEQNILGIIKFLFLQPAEALKLIFTSAKITFMLRIFGLLLFLPLFSSNFYIAIPIFLQILLLESPIVNESYYLAGAIPFIFIGMIYVIQKIDIYVKTKVNSRVDVVNLLIVILFLLGVWGNMKGNIYGSFHNDYIHDKRFIEAQNIYDKRFYIQDDADRIAWKIIGMIPDNASVSATGDLLMPLSHRKEIYEFVYDELDDGGGYDYFDVDYIVINRKNQYFGAGHYAFPEEKDFRQLEQLIENNIFEILYEEKDFLLLKRKSSEFYIIKSKEAYQ